MGEKPEIQASGRPAAGDATPAAEPASAFDTELQARLEALTRPYSYADISRLTGFHRETCRRYLTSGIATTEFISALAAALGVSVHWLLLGIGPCKRGDGSADWLHEVKPVELVMEVGRRWRGLQATIAQLQARLSLLEAKAHFPGESDRGP